MKTKRFVCWSAVAALVVGAVLLRARDITPQGSWVHQTLATVLWPPLKLLDWIAVTYYNRNPVGSLALFFPVFGGYWLLLGALIGFIISRLTKRYRSVSEHGAAS